MMYPRGRCNITSNCSLLRMALDFGKTACQMLYSKVV